MKQALVEMTPRTARTEAERFAACKNLTTLDKAIMKAYRLIAHGGKILKLDETLQLGGYSDGLPKLAICRADATRVDLKIEHGWMRFSGNAGYYQKKAIEVRSFSGIIERGETWAKTPYIPPYHRRQNLTDYLLLWEVTWLQRPRVSDPILLQKIESNLYRVVAAWDITPLEAAVLSR